MKSISFSPKSGSPGSGSKRLFCLDGFSQRFEKLRVSMTTDGFPQWKPKNEFQNIVLKFSVIISLFATFLAVVGVDLIIVLFPEKFDDIALETLLTTLLAYLSFELMGLCIFVRGFLFSWFFYLDFISILAVIVEVISIDKTSDPLAFWDYCRLHSLHHFPILRTSRGARFAARLGRLSTLRINKATILNPQSSDSFNAIASPFARHNENKVLYAYIKEKFLDAFREQERNALVSRNDFTPMIRNILKLDLEPEEEEVLYRLMTVFGRSKEIKFIEDQINNTESTTQARKHWATLRTTNVDTEVAEPNPAPTNPRRKSATMRYVEKMFVGATSRDSADASDLESQSPGSQTMAINTLMAQESVSEISLEKSPEDPDERRNSLPSFSTATKSLINPFKAKRAIVPASPACSDVSLTPSPQTRASQLFNNLTSIDSSWNRINSKKVRNLTRNASLTNIFRTTSSENENAEEEKEISRKQAELSKNAEEMKMFEEQNPITAMRLKMTTSIIPLELDTISWGLQLFREVQNDDEGHAHSQVSPVNQRLHVKSKIYLSEFETRMQEVLIIDGDHIFDSLRSLQNKKNQEQLNLLNKRSSIRGLLSNRAASTRAETNMWSKRNMFSPKVQPIDQQGEDFGDRPGSLRSSSRSHSDPLGTVMSPPRWSQRQKSVGDVATGVNDTNVEPFVDDSSDSGDEAQDKTSSTMQELSSGNHRPTSDGSDEAPQNKPSSTTGPPNNHKRAIQVTNHQSPPSSVDTPTDSFEKNKLFSNAPALRRNVTLSQKETLNEDWVLSVIDKVKVQMKAKQKEDIEKDLHFGSGNSIADHIGRGSIRIAIFGVFVALLVAPQLNYPTHLSCNDVNGGSIFRILKTQVRNVDNLSYSEGLITPTSCSLVREDSDISTVVREYSTFDPPPSSFVSTVARCLKIMHIISTTMVTMMTTTIYGLLPIAQRVVLT